MGFPKNLEVRIIDESGKPVPNAFALVVMKMPSRNDHQVWIGPSDKVGRIESSRAEIFAEARKDTTFFIMDYDDPSKTTGEFNVYPVTHGDVEKALQGYQQFRDYYPYRANWRAQLLTAKDFLQNITPSVEVTAQ